MTTVQYNKLHFTFYWIFLINIYLQIADITLVEWTRSFLTLSLQRTLSLNSPWNFFKTGKCNSYFSCWVASTQSHRYQQSTQALMFMAPIRDFEEPNHKMQTKYSSCSPLKLQSSLLKLTWNILTVPQCCLDHGNARYPFKMSSNPSTYYFWLLECQCKIRMPPRELEHHPWQDEANIFKWRCCP